MRLEALFGSAWQTKQLVYYFTSQIGVLYNKIWIITVFENCQMSCNYQKNPWELNVWFANEVFYIADQESWSIKNFYIFKYLKIADNIYKTSSMFVWNVRWFQRHQDFPELFCEHLSLTSSSSNKYQHMFANSDGHCRGRLSAFLWVLQFRWSSDKLHKSCQCCQLCSFRLIRI